MVAGIVISCRGTARSARVRIAKLWNSQRNFVEFRRAAKAAWHSHNNSHSDSPVAARHLIDRGYIAFAILRNMGEEIFSDPRALQRSRSGTHQVAK